MKATFFKIIFSVLSIFGLASCLGDSVGYSSGTGFAYVSTDEYSLEPVAIVLSGNYAYAIKSSVLSNSDLSVGDCAYVNFKVYSDKYSGNIYITDEFEILKEFPSREHLIPQLSTPTDVTDTDTINVFEKVSVTTAASNDIIKDKWLIGYKATLQKDQKANVTFYYDARDERQPDFEKGIVYLDVRINKVGTVDGDKFSSADKSEVVDLSVLRRILLDGLTTSKTYQIYFRYYVNEKSEQTNNVTKPTETSALVGALAYIAESGS